MKHPFPFLSAMLTVLTTFAAAPNIPELKDFRAPVVEPRECVKGFLWLEAESFADYGEWKLDTQFTHKMGSGCIMHPKEHYELEAFEPVPCHAACVRK